jgi:hypothetical protein
MKPHCRVAKVAKPARCEQNLGQKFIWVESKLDFDITRLVPGVGGQPRSILMI